MNKEEIALKLTKLYFEQQNFVPSKQSIIEIYFSFLHELENKGDE